MCVCCVVLNGKRRGQGLPYSKQHTTCGSGVHRYGNTI